MTGAVSSRRRYNPKSWDRDTLNNLAQAAIALVGIGVVIAFATSGTLRHVVVGSAVILLVLAGALCLRAIYVGGSSPDQLTGDAPVSEQSPAPELPGKDPGEVGKPFPLPGQDLD